MIRSTLLFVTLFWAAVVNGQNVMISNQGSPNEPSIMMDPLHPNVIIGAANINKYYISLDTGRTWTAHSLQSSNGVWGDPTITVDVNSHFYFFHLSNPPSGSWIDRIVCQKTTDNGETWNDGSFTGLNGTKAQDKQWCVIDRTDNTIYLSWTQFDEYGSTVSTDSSIIYFSKSVDGGETWATPLRINKYAGDCIDSDNTVEGAVPAVGANGEIYVAWAGPNGIVFNKSLDKGVTWLANETPVDPMPTGWDYEIPGISRANGLPVTVCDLSNGPNRGTIYINWSDQRNGADDTDVWLAKSTDGGETWSGPLRVNDDGPGKQQFFTYMAIDQATGYLYFVFYDRRFHTGDSTDVFLALSTDGGNTFINRLISESPFLPNNGVFFGDYTNITVNNGIVRPIWARLNGGQMSIWTHLTTEHEIVTSTEATQTIIKELNFENYPNPANDIVYVSYSLRKKSIVNLSLINAKGNVVRKLVSNEKRDYGKYVEKIDLDKLKTPSGVYLLQLEVDKQVITVKQVIIQ